MYKIAVRFECECGDRFNIPATVQFTYRVSNSYPCTFITELSAPERRIFRQTKVLVKFAMPRESEVLEMAPPTGMRE
jgi:hypothetical protein